MQGGLQRLEPIGELRRTVCLRGCLARSSSFAVPEDVERLLAVAPEAFVEERKKLARTLREDGRREEAALVAALKKPSPVVLAVNRAARDRPQAARDATRAAERLGRAQVSGKPGQFQGLLAELEAASALLSDVALANLSKGKPASDAIRRRVAQHIRGALAREDARDLLLRGALTDELEAPGFDAFSGLPLPKRAAKAPSRNVDVERKRRKNEKELRKRIGDLRRAHTEVERRVAEATDERDELADAIERLEGELRETVDD
jgi:hypothetical protein